MIENLLKDKRSSFILLRSYSIVITIAVTILKLNRLP
jgi:hypothetical protein